MKARTTPYRLVVLVSAIGMVIAGCSSSGGSAPPASSGASQSGGTTSSNGTSSAVAQAQSELTAYSNLQPKLYLRQLSQRPPSGKSVIYIQNPTPNGKIIGDGIAAACQALGWSMKRISQSGTPESIQGAFEQAIAQKPDVIMSAAADPAVLARQRAEMASAGIAFVDSSNVYTSSDKNLPLSLISGPDEVGQTGRLAADYAIATSNANVHAAYVTIPEFPALGAFQKGFDARLAELCPNTCVDKELDFKVTDVGTNMPSGVVSALQRDSSLNYVVLAGDFDGGLVSALRTAGLQNQVKIVGFAPTEAQLQEVKDGTEAAAIAVSDQISGWEQVDVYALHLAGIALAQQASTPTSSAPPAVPKVLITKDNVDQIEITPNFNKPDGYEALFKKSWDIS